MFFKDCKKVGERGTFKEIKLTNIPNIMMWINLVGVVVSILAVIGSAIYFISSMKAYSESTRLLLTSECNHIKEIIDNNRKELKEDIARLEKKQEESNKIKERLAKVESFVQG
jgi:Tfp pilus assembly protein PilN